MNYIVDKASRLFEEIEGIELDERVQVINEIRKELARYSPFKNEPVDCVQWIKSESVKANQYNPNSVAPPEMELLHHSINSDGYTQPIVSWPVDGMFEVIDGFHRSRVGKEYEDVKERINGYLPLVVIGNDRREQNDRMASTIRHNRARGKHSVDSMSDIVIELKNRNWKNERIARELGMDEDEILRLCQITGLADLFSDDDFSKSWDIENSYADSDKFIPLDENDIEEGKISVRTVNTSDEKRVFHTFDKWECHKAGFYATTKEGMTKDECEQAYADFLSNTDLFAKTLEKVTSEWVNSCEHYLTNDKMNRIAWLGQASVCYHLGVPSFASGGFYLMSEEQQLEANKTALIYLNKWLENRGMEKQSLDSAMTNRQSTIY